MQKYFLKLLKMFGGINCDLISEKNLWLIINIFFMD